MPPVFWSALLLLIGLGLVMVEIFVPSGGILGFLSFTSILAAIILAFYHSGPLLGVAFLVVACLAVPVALGVAFRFLPQTPIGRRLLPTIPTTEEVMPDSDQRRRLRELVGRVGRAKSKMRLSGSVLVDGHTIDAVSDGMPIEPDQAVRVIEVRGNLVVVRPVDESAVNQPASDDPLSRPIESLGLDPFDDPLT
jgi:membrane-bound ClpP family serine protease